MKHKFITVSTALMLCLPVFSQQGNLFIIGGGHKSKTLMQQLVATAQLRTDDYIAFLPMATTEPDTGYFYIKESFAEVCHNKVINFNFTKNDINKTAWLDSVKNAKLIYLGGGDQSRFMDIVLHTPIQSAIQTAYTNGATIAGTSAGAAMMAHYMITGNQLLGDTAYESTFPKLWNNNIEIKEGLSLLDSAIIDMHFIVRSRYNRLLTAIAAYPSLPCIGIDEGTAVIVHGNNAKVVGASQVIVFAHPQNLHVTKDGFIKFEDVQMSIYTEGDSFQLK
ncbi:cyanophycinase [Parafilimonas sp.]|uniref:cyanophycinase n=1 Tax=Parafilimonas sp. TaxID=1969739 RepID=UPI0039E54200